MSAPSFTRIYNGITVVPQSTITPSALGDLRYNPGTNKLDLYNGAVDQVVTETLAATLTNKILSGNVAVTLTSGTGTIVFNTAGTITVPSITDTLVGRATTDTLTNKTLDTATNVITNLTNTNLSGSAGITGTNLAANTVANSNLATMPTLTIKGNNTGGTATPLDLTVSQVQTMIGTSGSNTGDVTLATVGTSPNANAASLAGQVLNLQPADATNPGVVSVVAQTFTGAKTFATSLQTPTAIISGTGGNVTVQAATGSTTSYSLKLPATQATSNGQVIANDAAGNLSWITPKAGTKNYLTAYTASLASGVANTGNGDFETGTTTGWSLGTVGTLTNGIPTGTPTFGSGASGNLSLGIVSSGQLANLFSLSYTSSSATTAGNMVASDAFFIDAEDQAKVITFKVAYKVQSGVANTNFSGTSGNSFGIAAFDVTNSSWLSLTGNFSMTQTSGVGLATGTFQTNVTTASIRFIIYNASVTTGAVTMYFDDIFVGPQTVSIGPVMTDPVAFTPTGSWTTNTTYTGNWARQGRYAHFNVRLTLTGAPTSANLSINLPAGMVIDETVLGLLGEPFTVGQGSAGQTGNANLIAFSSGTTAILVAYQSSVTGVISPVTQSAPMTFASGGNVNINFSVPIVGWSANAVQSSDTDSRVVAMRATTASTSLTSATLGTIIFSAVAFDKTASYNSTTGVYTFPVTGQYRVSAAIEFAANATGGRGVFAVFTGKTSGGFPLFQLASAGAATDSVIVSGSILVDVNAGDTALIQGFQRSGGALSLSGSANDNYFQVERLSGPAVISASESVNMTYGNTNAQSLANATNVTITNWTKSYDSHNTMNASTGIYTVPGSGTYRITASLEYAINATGGRSVFAVLTGASAGTYALFQLASAGAATDTVIVNGSRSFKMLAGDTILIQGFQRSGGALALSASASDNYVSIERVGN